MPVTMTRLGDTVTASVSGEIDHHTARELRDRIDRSAERYAPATLVLDLSGVTFMDSSGIGLIMGRCKLMSELGGSVRVTGASGSVIRMIKLAGLSRLGIEIIPRVGEDKKH